LHIAQILKALGPAASIIFAAWIFMGFLQQRYDAALARYRGMVERYRVDDASSERRDNMRDQIRLYRRRCAMMNVASIIGLTSAILLILTLITGELSMLGVRFLTYVSASTALAGFILVIVAAGITIAEGIIIRRQLDAELLDVADLARDEGQHPGSINDSNRTRSRKSRRYHNKPQTD
jgi:hypothetical protein